MPLEVERVDSPPTTAPPDLAFIAPRRTLLGWGLHHAIEIEAPWVDHREVMARTLREIADGEAQPDAPGTGAVGFAALPFDRRAPARMLVPEVLWTRLDDGTQFVSRLGPLGAPAPTANDDVLESPRRVTFSTDQSVDAWCAGVAEARELIRRGELDKVVLARRLAATADRPWNVARIFDRLCSSHPHSYRYMVDGFVGASPELLVSRIGDVVRARPMAGTLPRTGVANLDAAAAATLMASEKNRIEHAITIDAVHDALLEWCSYLDSEPTPRVVDAGSVQHLATPLEGRLGDPRPEVADLLAALHPTPTVGGHPRDRALDVMERVEPFGRGRYAGPVGWTDAGGNGSWAVGIRGAEVAGTTATLCAGVGVVADSDPLEELRETRAKFSSTTGAFLEL